MGVVTAAAIAMPASAPGQVLTGWHRFHERVSVGVAVGAPLTKNFSSTSTSTGFRGINPDGTEFLATITETFSISRSFLAGPMLDVKVRGGLSAEVEALHHPIHSVYTFSSRSMLLTASGTSTTWDVPLLAKYTFRLRALRPFAEAGPSFHVPARSLSVYGSTAGVGLQISVGPFNVAPMVRYTHWAQDNASRFPVRNELQFLAAFSF